MTSLERLPVVGTETVTHRKRVAESINGILDFSADESRRQTPDEKILGINPLNPAFPPGDIRRYGATLLDTQGGPQSGANWFCYGQSATRINDTTFTVPGDYRTRYYITSRIRLTDASGNAFMGRVQNSTVGTGVTRIVVQSDGGTGYVGNVPTAITSLSREESVGQGANSSFLYDADGAGQGPFIWNRSEDDEAYGQLQVAVGKSAPATNVDGETIYGADVAVAIRAVPSTRSDSLLNGGNGIAVGASIVIHTGEAVPIIIGTHDQERLFISAGTSAIIFLNAQEAARFVSPREDNVGGVYITGYERDNSTRKWRIGADDSGVSDRLIIAQEENAPLVLSGGSKHGFTNTNKAFVFDVLDEYADDAAAASGGVEVGELYCTGSIVKQRRS